MSGHRTVAAADSLDAVDRRTPARIAREDFDSLVRDVLEHLYDRATPGRRQLGELLGQGTDATSDDLQQLLLDVVERLKPGSAPTRESPEWRRYLYVCKRYVEGASLDRVRDDLAIGERQARRYNHEALRYVSDVLWSRYGRERFGDNEAEPPSRKTTADETLAAELANLRGLTTSEPTSFTETLNSVLMTVEKLLRTQRVALDVSLPADLPPVTVPRVILRQILLGFLLHVGERHAGSLMKLTANQRGDTVEIRIMVRQRHAGSSPRTVVRGTSSTRSSRGSTFDTIQRLVELQRGTLSLHQNDGGAVSLRVTLPASSLRKVLVIDDNLDFRRLFQRFLEGSPFCAQYAEVTDDYTQLTREARPQVIILDVMMPTLDGWEVLQALKSQPETRDIPVIVCSVLSEPALARTLGASDVLVKPITRRDLLAALDRHQPGAGATANRGFAGDKP